MKKLFISQELAKLAKDKGFNDPCLAYYTGEVEKYEMWYMKDDSNRITNSQLSEDFFTHDYTAAPIYQQIFNWFFEYHNIFIQPIKCDGDKIYINYRLPFNDTLYSKDEVIGEAFKLI